MSRYALNKEHRDYFRDFGKIVFHDLVSDVQLKKIHREIKEALAKRGSLNQEAHFRLGRDLWRDCPTLQTILLSQKLATIAAELSHERVLRLAFDQFLPDPLENRRAVESEKYPSYLESASSLEERSCINGLTVSLLLCIEGTAEETTQEAEEVQETEQEAEKEVKEEEGEGQELEEIEGVEEEIKEPCILPTSAGEGVFFRSDLPLNFLPFPPKHSYLLIAYGMKTSMYLRHPTDPHEGSLKPFGYVFGDRLHDNLHPIVFR